MGALLCAAVVQKRDGRKLTFDRSRIENALAAAFCEELASENLDPKTQEEVERLVGAIILAIGEREEIHVEEIQDHVERELMSAAHYNVARRYIVYREARARARALRESSKESSIHLRSKDGKSIALDVHGVKASLYQACRGLECCPEDLIDQVFSSLYDGMEETELERALILAARSRIERHPDYGRAATRLLLNSLYQEVFGADADYTATGLKAYLETGIEHGLLDERLLSFDLKQIAKALRPERDESFTYLGLQTICDRYLLNWEKQRFEAPQFFWMRVAMGLSLEEDEPSKRACEFYELLSTFRFVSATPTLFNSGTTHPQLSSCYLMTVKDDLQAIFKAIGDDAQLSKWAGGLGNDWTQIRGTGAKIKGTNGESQGVIPFLKIVNDTAVAVNQGGKRRGSCCCYLETWHWDIEDFLDLRKNTGDDRRRTHDVNTAHWIPDLFMKRVEKNEEWTLFSPDEVDLHDVYGKEFEKRYTEYEAKAAKGEIRLSRKVHAKELWRKMLSMLFETGHPWITFKDPSNIRSPQDHAGVVHSSNLCTEILLNTCEDEVAVCNLGSINLSQHCSDEGLDEKKLAETIKTAVRMLDNVIDINFYPISEAKNSNQRHRPIGLGLMGFQDALYKQRISYASEAAVDFADWSMELISYHAILASAELAKERGRYSSYEGSKWDRGLLPLDTVALLEEERGGDLSMSRSCSMDWDRVRKVVAKHGMRNSNVMAIAPTATISNISGAYQSIEPSYSNLFVKSNLSGEFTIVNHYLVKDLQERGLWDAQMLDDLKYFDGSLQEIDRVPADLKELYLTAFEVDARFIIEAASRRQKYIDMGQSLNLYLKEPKGPLLDDMYFLAWRKGLKTTYYLRSLAATQVEKSSIDINQRGIQPRWMKSTSASSRISNPRACSLDDPTCEACQ